VGLDAIKVKQPGGKKNQPARRREYTGQFNLSIRFETLILPSEPLVPKVKTANLDKEKRKPVERTMLASADAYLNEIPPELFKPATPPIPAPGKPMHPSPGPNATVQVDPKNINVRLGWRAGSHAAEHEVYFGEGKLPAKPVSTQKNVGYQPPKLEVGKTYVWRVDQINESGKTTGDVWKFTLAERKKHEPVEQTPTDTVKPPPPPPALRITSILMSPLTQQVVLVDPKKPNDPSKRIEVGEELYGEAVLIFVHPKGCVVEQRDKRYFHPKGRMLTERAPLTQEAHPEIYYELAKLEKQLARINGAG
jgi:hypothetical protein